MEERKITGVCHHCGQVVVLTEQQIVERDGWDIDQLATYWCRCPQAFVERRRAEDWEKAQEKVSFLFVECEEMGLKPVGDKDLETIRAVAKMVCDQAAEKVSLQLRSEINCQVSRNAKGEVMVKRTDTRSSKA